MDLSVLNEPQKRAVTSNQKQILTIAGAGSGKTRVLTMRIARLIEEGINPKNILALTFTNKASKEMKERIEKMIQNININDLMITTFHSFCNKVLRRYIESYYPNFNKNFKILDDDDTKKLVQNCIERVNETQEFGEVDTKEWFYFLGVRNGYELSENQDDYKFTLKVEEAITEEISSTLEKENSLTFDDLQIKAYKVLRHIEKARTFYQDLFEHILVDEFQDTDPLQFSILKIVMNKHKRIFAVGDDFQSIYSFRGSNFEIIMNFTSTFPDAEMIKLEQNYRSTPEIIDLANNIISTNVKQIKKNLFTKNQNGNKPVLIRNYDYQEESRSIVRKIQELNRQGVKYSQMAILYRINNLSRCFEDELIKNKIPYTIHNGLTFYKREEIKDIIAFLYLIANPKDNASFRRIVNKPRKKIGEVGLNKLELESSNYQNSMLLLCSKLGETKEACSLLKKFSNTILSLTSDYLSSKITLIELINNIIWDTGYINYLEEYKQENSEKYYEKLGNLEEFVSIISEYENEMLESKPNTLDRIFEILQNIMLFTDDSEKEEDAVNLMTIHSSKGLEFDVVFLPAIEENIFPTYRVSTIDELEEERRLFYVGITRAKKKLFLSYSKKRLLNGKYVYSEPSIFINETRL